MDQSSGPTFLLAELAASGAMRPGMGAGRKQRQSRPSKALAPSQKQPGGSGLPGSFEKVKFRVTVVHLYPTALYCFLPTVLLSL